MASDLNLTFSGAGFLGMYQVGVSSCLKFYGRKLLDTVTSYGGCSAGAMCAVCLLCDMEFEQSVLIFMDAAATIRDGTFGPLSPAFDPVSTIRKIFTSSLPTDAYKKATGRLFISMTRVSDWKNVIVSEFDSNRDLIDALCCTTFIPFYSGVQPPKYRGVSYIDGGFTDNLLQHFDGTTITVSVFSGDSDICPDDGQKNNNLFDFNNVTVQFNGHNVYRLVKALFPADNTSLTDLCRQGFKDTLKYLYEKYPDMLSIDVDIVSVPYCCGGCVADDERNITSCWCGTEEEEYNFSEMEKAICKETAIKSLIIPETIYHLLCRAEAIQAEPDFIYYASHTIFQLAKWLASPSYYLTKHIYYIANDLFHILMPRLEHYGNKNLIVSKIISIAKHAFHAYHNAGTFEWHPSLGEEKQAEINKTRQRFISAERSFVALHKPRTHGARVSVSVDGSDLPSNIRDRGWSQISNDVFLEDEPKKERSFSSSSIALFMRAKEAFQKYTSKEEEDYGNDLDYENDDGFGEEEEYNSDSMDEDDHVSPIYF